MQEIIQTNLMRMTKREKDVFLLISKGSSNKMCADVLGISRRTVEVHRANILHKYNVQNITQLSYLVFND